MWLIVGLGNPGRQYEWTRHNCGFLVVDKLAQRAGRELRVAECQALTGRATIGGTDALIVKPQTYMNLSGVAVAALKEKYGIEEPGSILVISDDLALPFGKIRIRPQGSAGGHNGLKSIIGRLGTQGFPRLRIGIAPDHPLVNPRDFVLEPFPRIERQALDQILERAANAVEDILQFDVVSAMSKYN